MKGLLKTIHGDLRAISKGSMLRVLLVFFYNTSFKLLLNYRIGSYLHYRRNYLINLWILGLKRRQLKVFSCDISYEAQIGKNISFPHPIGIVIGTGCIINDNVKIWQHVTLGSDGKSEKNYPIIDKNVKIYSNAQIIGKVKIGENSVIGASALVLNDVPKDKIAVGIPAKIIN